MTDTGLLDAVFEQVCDVNDHPYTRIYIDAARYTYIYSYKRVKGRSHTHIYTYVPAL